MSIKKILYIVLGSICIGICSILSGLLLLTNYVFLQYISLIFTYGFGIYFVKTKNKYV